MKYCAAQYFLRNLSVDSPKQNTQPAVRCSKMPLKRRLNLQMEPFDAIQPILIVSRSNKTFRHGGTVCRDSGEICSPKIVTRSNGGSWIFKKSAGKVNLISERGAIIGQQFFPSRIDPPFSRLPRGDHQARSCANSSRVVFARKAGIASDSWLFIIPGLLDCYAGIENWQRARGAAGGG